jgi:hypothetical protein
MVFSYCIYNKEFNGYVIFQLMLKTTKMEADVELWPDIFAILMLHVKDGIAIYYGNVR